MRLKETPPPSTASPTPRCSLGASSVTQAAPFHLLQLLTPWTLYSFLYFAVLRIGPRVHASWASAPPLSHLPALLFILRHGLLKLLQGPQKHRLPGSWDSGYAWHQCLSSPGHSNRHSTELHPSIVADKPRYQSHTGTRSHLSWHAQQTAGGKLVWGPGCSSGAEHLPRMSKVLDSIPNTTNKQKEEHKHLLGYTGIL